MFARHLPLLFLAATSAAADESPVLTDLFAAPAAVGGVITIPPGDYHLAGTAPIVLPSNTTVFAHGARFHLPARLDDGASLVLFAGVDLKHFSWQGGEFLGHVFDPDQRENPWPPNASTRAIEIKTTRPGGTHDLLFRDVKSNGVAGAVIGVHGLAGKSDSSAVEGHAERVTLENCTLLRSGKFMWDYGYLWQILTWPEEYAPWEVERAQSHFRTDLIRRGTMKGGDDRIRFDNRVRPITMSLSREPKDAITFLGSTLPGNLARGRQYFVVEAGEDFIKVSDQPGGPALRFQGGSSEDAALISDLQATYLAAYAPTGGGPGKGAFDLVWVRDVRVSGCRLSALGDTMHIQRCENIVFADNHIVGSRMGAFFLAEYCRNATITGNLVDGTNGSRVVSVEKSCTDVTMIGNTFRNGGRGAWINQPVNFIMTGNLFVKNTTKNESDFRRGRIAYQTGQPGTFPELYFTLYEPGAGYGPVIVRDNVFVVGDSAPEAAVTFAPNGHNLQMTGNSFSRKLVAIAVDPTCEAIDIRDNPGAEVKRTPVDFNHGRR